MKLWLFMCALALVVYSVPLWAQDVPPHADMATKCERNPDRYELTDAGPGRAILYYYNSSDLCTHDEWPLVLTTEAGISVRVFIEVADAETIRVVPENPSFLAYPQEAEVKDGDDVEIIIAPPLM